MKGETPIASELRIIGQRLAELGRQVDWHLAPIVQALNENSFRTINVDPSLHTPTPWAYVQSDNVIRGPNGEQLIDLVPRSNDLGLEVRNANARYVVLCVNAHDALLKERNELKRVLTPIENQSPVLKGTWRHSNGMIFCGTLRIAKQDFDTDPSPEFRARLFDDICRTMNRASQEGQQ